MTRSYCLLDAPSNLGLKPPAAGVVPGVYKLAGALRDCGLAARLQAQEGGVVTPPQYRSDWQASGGTCNGNALANYSPSLADRLETLLAGDKTPVVLGGDCSILIGCALALRRRGRYGLVFLDGHSDFRHPGNSEATTAAAGEDLAIVTGRGDQRLVNIDGLRPYIADTDIIAAGMRASDEYTDEMRNLGIEVIPAEDLHRLGPGYVAERVQSLQSRAHLDGFWIHLDLDILDAEVLPAVDSPETHGLSYEELGDLLEGLVGNAIGIDVTIYDPDLDPQLLYAPQITDLLVAALNAGGL